MTATLTTLVGLPGSGKSTAARRQVEQVAAAGGKLLRSNRDDLRRSMFPRNYRVPQPELEDVVTAAQHAAIRRALQSGWDVVVDDCNLLPEHTAQLRALASDCGASFAVDEQFLAVEVDECVRRDTLRPPAEQVGEVVIRELHASLLSSG